MNSQETIEEEKTSDLNTRVPETLHRDVKKAAVDLGVKIHRFAAFGYRILLYFKENNGVPETVSLARRSYPVACLHVARNDLQKQGYDTSTLDAEIARVEAFVEKEE